MKLYKFIPDPDITAYELSIITKNLIIILINSLNNNDHSNDDNLEIEQGLYDKLPDNVKQYFK